MRLGEKVRNCVKNKSTRMELDESGMKEMIPSMDRYTYMDIPTEKRAEETNHPAVEDTRWRNERRRWRRETREGK